MTTVWRVARVLLLVLWVIGAGLTWWSSPREVSYERALAAVDNGEAEAYQWGSTWEDRGSRWFDAPALSSTGESGPWFAWRTGDDRVFWTDTSLASDQTTGEGAASLARKLDQPPAGDLIPWRGWLQGISIVLALTGAVLVIAGPAPVRGTRWYWWWMLVFVPYGLGLVLWLFRDRPWANAQEGSADRDRGWFGLVTAVLANFAVAIVLFLVSRLFEG
ncbi:hypothetical protein AB0C07_35230 [Actinoplanes missouriensis]|uniref:hypothetical protein n=1 Tax=Actinoplanes missouriensis TaxID=1866 RepID=UPI0034098D75